MEGRTALSARRDVKRQLEVWKFGGAALADARSFQKAAALVAAHAGPLLIVASAVAGLTDMLLEGAARAASGNTQVPSRVAAGILRRHRQIVKDLLPHGPARRKLFRLIDAAAREYRELCGAVAVLGHLEPRAGEGGRAIESEPGTLQQLEQAVVARRITAASRL